MAKPMTPERIAEIKADLAAVPAPPWRWIGTRTTGPMLVTDHSGQHYLLRPAYPLDEHGDQATDDEGRPLYADLYFRDEGKDDEFAILRRAAEMIVPRTDYDPETYRDIDNPMARWIKQSAEYVTGLLAEVKQLRSRAEDVRAIHPRETSAVTMKPVCGSCRDTYENPMPWPCPTIAELDGLDDGGADRG